jgi:hypothetical protein
MKIGAKLISVLCLVVLACAGCASLRTGPLETPSDAFSSRAKDCRPPPGWAAVYVIRPFGLAGAGSPLPVFLDHKPFGKLLVGSFLYAEIAPREHLLELAEFKGAENFSHRFTAQEGKCHYFHATVGFQLKLEPLPEEEGRQLVKKYDQSGDNQLDYGREVPDLPKK